MVHFFFNSCLKVIFVLEGAPVRLKSLHPSSSSINETQLCRFSSALNCTPDKVWQRYLNPHLDENQSNSKQKRTNYKEVQTLLRGHQDVGSLFWCHRRPCRVHRGPIMCERQLTLSTGFMKGRHDQSHDEPGEGGGGTPAPFTCRLHRFLSNFSPGIYVFSLSTRQWAQRSSYKQHSGSLRQDQVDIVHVCVCERVDKASFVDVCP